MCASVSVVEPHRQVVGLVSWPGPRRPLEGKSLMGMKGSRDEPVELEGFQEWLRARRLAPDFRVPYYARWVQRFLRLRASRRRETWRDTPRASSKISGRDTSSRGICGRPPTP